MLDLVFKGDKEICIFIKAYNILFNKIYYNFF